MKIYMSFHSKCSVCHKKHWCLFFILSNVDWRIVSISNDIMLCAISYSAEENCLSLVRNLYVKYKSDVPFGENYNVSVYFIEYFSSFVSRRKHDLRSSHSDTVNMVLPLLLILSPILLELLYFHYFYYFHYFHRFYFFPDIFAEHRKIVRSTDLNWTTFHLCSLLLNMTAKKKEKTKVQLQERAKNDSCLWWLFSFKNIIMFAIWSISFCSGSLHFHLFIWWLY